MYIYTPLVINTSVFLPWLSFLDRRLEVGWREIVITLGGDRLPSPMVAAAPPEITYFARKTMCSNRKLDIIDPNKLLILNLFLILPFIY